MSASQTLPGFEPFEFSYEGHQHSVYKKGDGSKPGVLIVQELPGITPETVALAERLHADGYTVYLPWLFGDLNVPAEPLKNLGKLCINQEFHLLANRRRSPITEWLRALCRKMKTETDGPVGAIGMCLTGGFVLALMIDEAVAAPVMSQPANLDGILGHEARCSLGMPEKVVREAAARSREADVPVLGLRFENDPLCPKSRFDTMTKHFGENFRRIEIDASLYKKHDIRAIAHSVLTIDFVDQPGHPTRDAYEQMIGFFSERLGAAGRS
ncbi:dienelactone hydrolase family protein [gamma proteobacterium HdN1]|nr:dienelactone hydrolase family protein [gamma proteobacterium HdN1]